MSHYILYWNKESAVHKEIGQNLDINIAQVSKNSKCGVDIYSIECKLKDSQISKVHTSS